MNIRAKCDVFLSFLSSLDQKFDVTCFAESNLKDGEQVGVVFINYKTLCSGRSNRQGGGVVICVLEDLDYEIIPQLTTNLSFIEMFTIKKLFKKQFIVSLAYRPPKANLDLVNTFIEGAFASEDAENHDKIVFGDFTLKLMNITEGSSNASVFSQKYAKTRASASYLETNAHICVVMLTH